MAKPCERCGTVVCSFSCVQRQLIAQRVLNDRLLEMINYPNTDDFFSAVRLEAAHQVERWGAKHNAGKEPQDWFWLLGYLGGKALASALRGDQTKALHHTISSAAVLLNWHRYLSGEPTVMRPGIAKSETKTKEKE